MKKNKEDEDGLKWKCLTNQKSKMQDYKLQENKIMNDRIKTGKENL